MAHAKNKGMKKSVYKQKMKDNRKQTKVNSQEKRARLVLRNLPFKSTEENLRQHYEQFGKVREVKLLKRPDGKLVGCAFIQYDAVQCAAKARFATNGTTFLGREISCDFAISKDRFVQKLKQDKFNKSREVVEVKEEADASIIKEEDVSEDEVEVKAEPAELVTKDESESNDKEESNDEEESKEESSEAEESDDSDEEETINEGEDDKNKEEIKLNTNEPRKPHVISNDVTEGKTIFVKNVPFDATNNDLKQCMRQFGTVYYALVCLDRATEHSKGTGFVKFVNKEDADKCLQAGTELTLLGNILDVHAALNKNDINKKSTETAKEKHKDSRNLYLIKEGVILAGTKAAEGLSAADMAKRLQLEQYKTQMLRNLNMFISRNRLVAHNLPPTWDDVKLKTLFLKHAGDKAFIKESKIMRDMKQIDANGLGASKEFGFITFTTHEHALNALRGLNNNPNIFSATKRPIVAFSIENRVMIRTKEKRLERSKIRNPYAKEYDANEGNNQFGNQNNRFGNQNNKFGKFNKNNSADNNVNNKFGNNPNNKFNKNSNFNTTNNKFGNNPNNKFNKNNNSENPNSKFGNNPNNKFNKNSNFNNTNSKFGNNPNNKFNKNNNSDNPNNKIGNNPNNKFNKNNNSGNPDNANNFGNNSNNNKFNKNTNPDNNSKKNTNPENNSNINANPDNNSNNNHPKNNKFSNNKSGKKRKFEETTTSDKPNNFTGVEASPGIKKMRSRYNLKSQAELHNETMKTEKKKKKMAKKSLQERKQEFIRQPQQKIGKKKHQDNDNFSKMVNDYKAKLIGASSSSNPKQNNKGKWFDE